MGFSFSTSRTMATDLNTETITSNNYEVFLSFLTQSPWTAYSWILMYNDSILQFYLQSDLVFRGSWLCTNEYSSQSQSHIATDSQSVLVSYTIWGIWPEICLWGLILRKLQSCLCGRPLWREVGSVVCRSVLCVMNTTYRLPLYRRGTETMENTSIAQKLLFYCCQVRLTDRYLHSNEHSTDPQGTLLLLLCVRFNVFTEWLPSNGYTCYNILPVLRDVKFGL
jgi:hypothetical protein